MLRLSYPDTVVGNGFHYHHQVTGAHFSSPNLNYLREQVAKYCVANQFTLNNDEFEDNVCRNTPNCVCTEGLRGAGDLVHMVVNPIAKIIDRVTGTDLAGGCAGCAERQAAMNKAMPF